MQMMAEKEEIIETKNKEIETVQLKSAQSHESQLELQKEFDNMKIQMMTKDAELDNLK